MLKNPAVNESFSKATRWKPEAEQLREILLKCDLTEELKWGKPCYTHEGKNICIIQRMKDFLALLFFKGALLEDPNNVLEAQGPNSRSGYRMRFTSAQDVAKMAKNIKVYPREAIDAEKAGLQIKRAADFKIPQELKTSFIEDPDFKAAFERLTPGRRRGYALHFSAAKHSKTRAARIEKFRRHIVAGKGIHDR